MMTPESTTIPTCECARVYVCVQCMKEVEHSEVMTPESRTTVMYVYSYGRKSLLGSVVCLFLTMVTLAEEFYFLGR